MHPLKSVLIACKITLYFCCTYLPLASQSQLKYQTLTTEDGLSSNWINSVFQDSYGFIWLSTTNGLNRYDGYEIKQYFPRLNDSTSISGSLTTFIYEDKDQNIWVGTWANGLNLYDRKTETFRRFIHDPKDSTTISSNSFVGWNLMLEDHAGNFWVGTDNGLNLFDRSTSTFRKVPIGTELTGNSQRNSRLHAHADIRAANRIRGMYQDKKQNLWIGTDWGGLYKYNYETKSFTGFYPDDNDMNSISHTTPAGFIEDDAGNLWIFHFWDGICKLDLNTGKFQRFPNDHNDPKSLAGQRPLSGFFLDKDLLWIGTNNGLSTFDIKQHILHNIKPVNSDFEGYLSPHLKDVQGNYWLASGKGILIVNTINHGFEKYTIQEDNPKSISARSGFLGVDSKGHVYVLHESGVDVLNEKKEKIKTLKLDPSEALLFEAPTCFLENKEGKLFFVGAHAYTIGAEGQNLVNVFPGNEYPTKGYTSDVYLDTENTIWFAGNGINVFNPKSQDFERYNPAGDGNFAENSVNSLLELSSGQLLMGGVWDGLFLFDTKKREFVKRFPIGEGNGIKGTTVTINKIFRSADQKIWLGSNYGLSLFDPTQETFKHYSLDQGLPSNTVYCILEDDHHVLWLSTGNGLSRFDPATESFRNYDHLDGLQGNEFFEHHGAIKHPITRELWFSGANGITVFHPDSIMQNTYVPPILFTKLVYYNKNKNNGQAITDNTLHNKEFVRFSYSDNIIEFHFAALNFVSPEKNKYAYRLTGFNDEWVALGTRREVSFTNLSPGTYTLYVKGSNNDGIWNEEGASIKIIISPPWWRTWWAYGLYSTLILFLIWRLVLYQKARTIHLERERNQQRELAQAKEIEKAYSQLAYAHENLKSTQAQLIQSEKMASLGELTAGIAHEIQNPLNFVNNFSEVNTELIDELQHELKTGNTAEAITLSNSIKENEEKINQHGKRADAIVKGMLQHSRASSGTKEPTDINALTDEYLRLAYHGIRAKDKSFNAKMITDFDQAIGKINVIPQDIGRVILNLITNSFYAVSAPKSPKGDFPYEPTVTVSTKLINSPPGDLGAKRDTGDLGANRVQISVRDNGTGIPKNTLDKIFQPFFTTKPTGQGTGLGLSMSYDIIKAHGGELKVETKEGEYAEFIITLPIQTHNPN